VTGLTLCLAASDDSKLFYEGRIMLETIDDKRRVLREMLLARRFEERCYEAYVNHDIGGFLHLYPGQEACAYGVLEAARPGHDYVITGYRDHVHALKAGVSPRAIMAELYGKEAGCSKGRGGSMHLFSLEHRFMGGYALVGGPFPLAAGIAKGIKMKGGDEICISFLGDAANNQGTFHETFNMASIYQLPMLHVCENNRYGIGTAIERSTAMLEQAKRLCGYDVPSNSVDGQDIEVVYAAAREAVEHVRSGKGPFFLELTTYRFRGHSMSDSGAYRSREEVAEWMQRDPITLLRDRLIGQGHLDQATFEAWDKQILDELEKDVIPFSEQAPEPAVADLEKYVFVENDPWVRPTPTGGAR